MGGGSCSRAQTVTVLCKFLSEFRDASGRDRLDLVVPAGSSLIDLIDRLCREFPGLREMVEKAGGSASPTFAVAVDGKEVAADRRAQATLREGSELLFFFPGVGG